MNLYKSIYKTIDTSLSHLAQASISLYQKTLSPDKGVLSPWLSGTVCAHHPHCSEYGRLCLQQYGFFRSITPIIDRVLSCGPGNTITYDPHRYRIAFASGATIGKPFLEALHTDSRFEIVGILTMPDAASGRGMRIQENSVATFAKSLGYDHSIIHKPHSLRLQSKKRNHEANETYNWLQELQIDFLVVVAYGLILPKHVLDLPTFGPINVHGSLLPKYRGASPLQTVFLDGEKETGVTIMYMDEGVDTGDMIDTKKTEIPHLRTVKNLIDWIEEKTPKFLCDTLWEFAKGRIDRIPQDPDKASHTQKIMKEDGLISFTDALESVYNKYQAYSLWPKVSFMYKNKSILIESILLDEGKYIEYAEQEFCNSTTLMLNPAILDCVVKPSGKKIMNRESFVNGYLKLK